MSVAGNVSAGVERQWSHAPGEVGRWHGGGVVGLGRAWITAWTPKRAYDQLAPNETRFETRQLGRGNTLEKK